MTDEQTLDQLKAEVAALKEQRTKELQAEAEQRKQDQEMARLQAELDELKAGRLPLASGQEKAIAEVQLADLKLARVRQGINGLAHFIAGPIASVAYGAKTGYWVPTLAATGVAVVTAPMALVDFGLTFAFAPPVTSCLLMCTKSNEKRRQLGIMMPEQADAMMAQVTRF